MSRRTSSDGPRILILDIETMPMLFFAWRAWDAHALRIVEDTSLASFSAKWMGREHITKTLADYKGYRAGSRDDKKLLRDLWNLLDEADIVVAHNGDKFDVKKINYRFMVHGMLPPSPYKTVDTLKEVKKVSSWDSHRLNELSRLLESGQKVRTGGADLWFDCLEGKRSAWERMRRYNKHDVTLLERVYLRLRPWMTGHPNHGAYTGVSSCPKCGSTKLQARGKQRAATRTYQRFQCQACGGWGRSSESTGERTAVVNVAR